MPSLSLYRTRLSKAVREPLTDYPINSSAAVSLAARALLGDADRESFAVFHLSARNHIVGVEIVSTGSLVASIVHPREVFKAAILANSVSIILVHNHPSGDPSPSREDLAVTRCLVAAGELLGITVLDHVIVGGCDAAYSFADHGSLT